MTLQEVVDLMAAADPKLRKPDPEDIAAAQRAIDQAAARLTPAKAAQLARLWLNQ